MDPLSRKLALLLLIFACLVGGGLGLVRNLTSETWQSYTFNSGAGNREGLQVLNFRTADLNSSKNIRKWLAVEDQYGVNLIGSRNDSIFLTALKGHTFAETREIGLNSTVSDILTFQKWNPVSQKTENYALVATCETATDFFLKCFKIHKADLVPLWSQRVHRNITFLNVISSNYELKLLIVHNHVDNVSARIYELFVDHPLDLVSYDGFSLEKTPAYMVISNCNDEIFISFTFSGDEIVYIYKYNKVYTGSSPFKLHQKIFTKRPTSLATHCFGFHCYLAIASLNSSLYKFNWNSELILATNENFGSLSKWLPIPLNTLQENLIFMAEGEKDITVVVTSGDGEFQVIGNLSDIACERDRKCKEEFMEFSARSAISFFHDGLHYIVFTSRLGEPKLLSFAVKTEALQSAVDNNLKKIYSFQALLQKKLEEHRKNKKRLDEANNEISKLISKPSEMNWKLDYVKTSTVLVPLNPNATVNSFEYGRNGNWTDDDYVLYMNLLENSQLEQILNDEINEMNKFFTDASNYDVFEVSSWTDLAFDNVTFLGRVTVNRLELSRLNNVDVVDMLQNSVAFTNDRKIGGIKTVINIKANYMFFEKLENIPANDVVYYDELLQKTNRNIINGNLVYENDLNILQVLDYLPCQGDCLSFTLYPYHHEVSLADDIEFENLFITDESVVEESLNELPLILPVHNSPFEVFSLDCMNQARVEVVNVLHTLNFSFINGQHIKQLHIKNLEPVKSLKIDDYNFYTKNLQINYLNNIKFPEGFINIREKGSITIQGQKNFYGCLTIQNLFTHETGDNDSNLNRKVQLFRDLIISGALVTERINNFSWDQLSDVLLKEKMGNEQITGAKYIKKCRTLENLIVKGDINSRDSADIMNTNTYQTLTLSNFKDIIFKSLNLTGYLYGMDFEELINCTVRLGDNQQFGANLIFDGEIIPRFNSLKVSGFINKIPQLSNDIVDLTHESVHLEEIVTENLIVNGSLLSQEQVNNINLKEFNARRMSTLKSQAVEDVLGHENVGAHNTNMIPNMKKGILSNHFEDNTDLDVVYKLLRDGSVKSIYVKGHIKTQGLVNGFNLTKYAHNAVRITNRTFVQKKITFQDTVAFSQIKVNGRLQGAQLGQLYNDLIYDSSYVHIKERKAFEKIFIMDKMKSRTLNDHLIQKVITKMGDHSLEGSITINGNVRILGNVTSYGSVNGSPISDLIKMYSSEDSYVITSDAVLPTQEIDQLYVEGSIKNKSLSSLLEDVVLFKNDTYITAKKMFLAPVKFADSVIVKEALNGLDIKQLRREIILMNETSSIEGSILIGKTIMRTLRITNDFNSTLIHGFDTNEWLEESIPLHDDVAISGAKRFADANCYGNIAVDHINNYLSVSIITLDKDQFIPCSAYFPRMISVANIAVEGSVNDRVLFHEYTDTVLIDDDQEVSGQLIFLNDFTAESDIIFEEANGRKLSNVVTLHTDQTISSIIIFNGTVITTDDVQDLKYINSINIFEWNQKSISLSKYQVISGAWVIKGNLTINKNVGGRGLLSGESISEVKKSIEKVGIYDCDLQRRRHSEYMRQCASVSKYSHHVSQQPYMFHHFEVSQILKTSVNIESVITFQAQGKNYLKLTFKDECLSILYEWREKASKFVFVNRVNIGPVTQWLVLSFNNMTYLITSSNSNVVCEENSKRGNIWIFYGNSDKYGHLFTMDKFSDILAAHDMPGVFYTLTDGGNVFQWNLNSQISRHLVTSLEDGGYKFLDFEVIGELAFTNGRHIKNGQNVLMHTFTKPHNGRIVVARINEKVVSMVAYHDEIIIYNNLLQQDIYASVSASKAESILWINIASQHNYLLYEAQSSNSIEIIHLKGEQNVTKKTTIPIPCHKLVLSTIPRQEDFHPTKIIIAVQKRKLILMEAVFYGNLYKKPKLDCT